MELDQILTLIMQKSPAAAQEAATALASATAARKRARFTQLAGVALSDPAATFTAEDRADIAEVFARDRLGENKTTYFGPFRATPAEKNAMDDAAKAAGLTTTALLVGLLESAAAFESAVRSGDDERVSRVLDSIKAGTPFVRAAQ